MARLTGLVSAAAAILGLTAMSASAQALPTPVQQQARLMLGGIQGVVVDDRGGPLAGAIVSALGVHSAMATTDARGRILDANAATRTLLGVDPASLVGRPLHEVLMLPDASDPLAALEPIAGAESTGFDLELQRGAGAPRERL